MSLACSYSHICSGCEFLTYSRQELEQVRVRALKDLNIDCESVRTIWIANGGLRTHLEFTLMPATNGCGPKFGLYEKLGSTKVRETIDLAGCPQLSPELEVWLQKFREDLPPLNRRSNIRLRISPSGLRGVWIDSANEAIRDLLLESTWLRRQHAAHVVVEIGQRRKRFVPEENANGRGYRLIDPVLEPWFQTLDGDRVYGTIASFTQPGWAAAEALSKEVLLRIPESGATILEFGSGSGSFTFPLLARNHRVLAFEFDRLALEALNKGVSMLANQVKAQLTIFEGDFIQSDRAWAAARSQISLASDDWHNAIALVDPPRSGLGKFLTSLTAAPTEMPRKWIYVSCYPESFARDYMVLKKLGYKIENLSIVEQFPYTRHFEIVATITAQALFN